MSLANKRTLETGADANFDSMDPKSIIGGGTTGKGFAISIWDAVWDVLLARGKPDFFPSEGEQDISGLIPELDPAAVLAKIKANTTPMPESLPRAEKGASTQDRISL